MGISFFVYFRTGGDSCVHHKACPGTGLREMTPLTGDVPSGLGAETEMDGGGLVDCPKLKPLSTGVTERSSVGVTGLGMAGANDRTDSVCVLPNVGVAIGSFTGLSGS